MLLPSLPEPPPDDRFPLPLAKFPAGCEWSRIHRTAHAPVHFNFQMDFRFNAPDGQFGVLYEAQLPEGALVETLLRTDGRIPPVVTERQLQNRRLSTLAWTTELHLVDLTGYGLVSLGIDGRLCAGPDYALTQRWSSWFWHHRERPSGVLYRSRHDPSQLCAALFSDRVPATPSVTTLSGTLLDNADLMGAILHRYRAALI